MAHSCASGHSAIAGRQRTPINWLTAKLRDSKPWWSVLRRLSGYRAQLASPMHLWWVAQSGTIRQTLVWWRLWQVIDAEIVRRQLLEEVPIPSTNEEPVLFDTAEIPWWAWIRRFHLPEVCQGHLLLHVICMACVCIFTLSLSALTVQVKPLCKASGRSAICLKCLLLH